MIAALAVTWVPAHLTTLLGRCVVSHCFHGQANCFALSLPIWFYFIAIYLTAYTHHLHLDNLLYPVLSKLIVFVVLFYRNLFKRIYSPFMCSQFALSCHYQFGSILLQFI